MMPELNLGILLGYRNLYPDEKPPDKSALAQIVGRDNLFKFCSHFLAHFRNDGVPENEQLLRDFFTFYQYQYVYNPDYYVVRNRYHTILEENPDTDFIFVSIEGLLKMFLWLTQHPEIPMEPPQDPEQILPLFQIFMLFNDEVLELYKNAYQDSRNIPEGKRLQQLTLAMSFSQTDFIHADYAQIFKTQFYKGAKLLEFMNVENKYQPLLQALLADFHCPTKEEYFKALGAAIVFGVQATNNGWTVLNVRRDANFEQACHVLDKLAISEEAIDDLQNDYLELRNRPLRKVGDGAYLVVYDMFLIKKIYNGLVFYFSARARKEPALFRESFLGSLRQHFSEGVLVYDAFDYIFPGPVAIKFTGDQFKKAGLRTEPDYYVRVENDLLLIESKDFYIKGETKLSYNFTLIEAELKAGRLGKAIEQLKTNIGRAIIRGLKLDTAYDAGDIQIYPVIVVHDALYSSPGLNYWVHFWMEDALQELERDPKYKGFDFKKIRPVTIVEIDTLLFYEENFRKSELQLIPLLREFHQVTQYGRHDFKNLQDIETHAKESVISFSQFVRYKGKELGIKLEGGRLDELLKKFGL